VKKHIVVVVSLCLILGFLGYAQSGIAQEGNKSETEALLKYQAEKKEPWVGVGAAFLVPSLGHAYAGNWGRGVKFLLIDVGCIALMSAGASEAVEGNTGLYTIGLLGLTVSRIWEYIDAYRAVEDYNKKVAEKYGVGVSLNFKQNNNGVNSIRLALNYEF